MGECDIMGRMGGSYIGLWIGTDVGGKWGFFMRCDGLKIVEVVSVGWNLISDGGGM